MNNAEVESTIVDIIADKLTVAVDRVVLDADLRRDLGADSISALEISWEIEERFRIEIPEVDMQRAKTVGDIVTYVAGKLQPVETSAQ